MTTASLPTTRPAPAPDDLDARARRVLTGPQSNLRLPGPGPMRFIDRAEGVHLFDTEGRRYLDFAMSMGPSLLGHAHPEWLPVVQAQLARCAAPVTSDFHSPLEVELAERIIAHVPSAERVKFCLSGTEAVQLAFRLARAATGRSTVLRFEGHYHGWLDNVLGGEINPDATAPPHPLESEFEGGTAAFRTRGRFPGALAETYKIPWNDAQAIDQIFATHGDHIALVIMEPIMCNSGACPPRPGYLEHVRAVCTERGALLAFDEIITGFRVGLGGAQGMYGVTPDLTILGKSLAAGLPLSAVVGREDVMRALTTGEVVGAGTFNSFPLGLASAVASLDILSRGNGAYYGRMAEAQAEIAEGLRRSARRLGLDLLLQGPPGVVYVDFNTLSAAYSPAELKESDVRRRNAFRALALENGLVVAGGSRLYMTGVMTSDTVGEASDKLDRTLQALAG